MLPADSTWKGIRRLRRRPGRYEIDEINDLVYKTVNNGVYKCGFAGKQASYEKAYEALFAALRSAKANDAKLTADRDELKESMVALQQTLQDMHEESAEQSQALMAIRADKEAADAENEALVENVAPLQEQIRELEQSEALLQTEEHLLMLTTAQLEVTARGWG